MHTILNVHVVKKKLIFYLKEFISFNVITIENYIMNIRKEIIYNYNMVLTKLINLIVLV